MPDGGTLMITTRRRPEGGAVLVIADTGIGIPEAVRRRIFEPFFSTKGDAGSGLGLAMVYSIITRHGGDIRVDSEPGQGATFTLSFPAGAPAGRPEGPPLPARQRRPGRLLVVDDDPQVLAAVRRDLRSRYREHYTVMSAGSGQEALDTARELKSRGDSLAMLISDQRMPGMLGNEVLARSRELYPLARRVLLTAYAVSYTHLTLPTIYSV